MPSPRARRLAPGLGFDLAPLALVALAVALHAADVATTLAGLRLGLADEGNPLNVALLRLGGPGAYAFGSTLWVALLLAAFATLARRWRRDPQLRHVPTLGLALAAAMMATTVAGNAAVLAGWLG